jgi:pyruvate,water dikinase
VSVSDPTGPVHTQSGPNTFWSTTNLGEALPGVVTPLGWSIWMPAIDIGVRDCFARMGALRNKDVHVPPNIDDRVASIFYGRAALNATFFCEMGGRLPGTGPDAIAKQLLGEVPAGIALENTLKRMPVVAFKMPYALATVRRDVLTRIKPIDPWWRSSVANIEAVDLAAAKGLLAETGARFIEMIRVQAGGVFIGVQPPFDQLIALIEKAGLDAESANALGAGQGSHAEIDIIYDLWALGREKITLEAFLSRHGYHGPFAGEISSVSWREDPSPVVRLAGQYGARKESDNPELAHGERTQARIAAEQQLLAKLPAVQRPGARLVLKMAAARIPLRGVAKGTYLQVLDVGRSAARRIGTLLVEQGTLDDRDDPFYLTVQELTGTLPANAKELVAERRAQREDFQRHGIPTNFRGNPEPYELAGVETPADDAAIEGIPASGGVVEGIVRIVHDPAFSDIEPDEVLVCVTTDPSWASVLFLSSALVVDIGGLLSHAAVVAREIGVPCVVGTRTGTKALRTGDRVRVDGNTGKVLVLERAPVPAS